ncbi:hypothetical protein N656DRAFT_365420 [Canariomyces notabilis]|uniref:Uncharacterized protein n=1 Tax=Canariomyces notabilis TaxID=2074819 RepID=A0AAN6QLC4_9PEZI|nr:hypothetical protein N656DRAFT_365420 [Canariomyces arenarius]
MREGIAAAFQVVPVLGMNVRWFGNYHINNENSKSRRSVSSLSLSLELHVWNQQHVHSTRKREERVTVCTGNSILSSRGLRTGAIFHATCAVGVHSEGREKATVETRRNSRRSAGSGPTIGLTPGRHIGRKPIVSTTAPSDGVMTVKKVSNVPPIDAWR